VDESLSDSRTSILTQRDAAMISLVAHGQTLITRLAMLTQVEKEAVLALVAIGQSLAGYARGIRPDKEVIESFERTLEALSPEGVRRAMPHSLLYACQEQSSAYAHAVAKCLAGSGKRYDDCELAAAAEANAEIACHTIHLKALHAALVPLRRPPAEPVDVIRPRSVTQPSG
jgi:hypothetical protein